MDFISDGLKNNDVKVNCPGDTRTFIIKNKEKGSFSAVLENRRWFSYSDPLQEKIKRSLKEGNVTFDFNSDTHTITIDLTLTDSHELNTLKHSSFRRLISGLNAESPSTACHLKHVDFFNQQFKRFSKEMSPETYKSSYKASGFPNEHYAGNNMAY